MTPQGLIAEGLSTGLTRRGGVAIVLFRPKKMLAVVFNLA
jgi:hypothetical protein